jgi:tetratricopeptide (TPR) repeat protein
MPYKQVGLVKNADKNFVMGLAVDQGQARVSVYATRPMKGARITLEGREVYLDTLADLSPVQVYEAQVAVREPEEGITLAVCGGGGRLSYTPAKPAPVGLPAPLPAPAKAIGPPETLRNTEALWLAGMHLEQYRHATYRPEPYYLEGLQRDPGDLRINNAYGNLLLRRGDYAGALACFLRAEATARRHSPNPYDGEVYFNLGKAHEGLGDLARAFDAYYKATWSDPWKSQGYLKLGLLAARRGAFPEALEHLRQSLYAGYKNMQTRGAMAILLRHTGSMEEARRLVEETLAFDPMDGVARLEQGRQGGAVQFPVDPHAAITLAQAYRALGLWREAAEILTAALHASPRPYAMLAYYLADCHWALGDNRHWGDAAAGDPSYCFPNSLEDYAVLQNAARQNPADANALYYTGCLLYDKQRHADAAGYWEAAAALRPEFPTVHRNLALYCANKQRAYPKARGLLEKAFALDEGDARVFYELCALYSKIGLGPAERRAFMERHLGLVHSRDDLVVLYGQALHALGEYQAVIDLLKTRRFHPWEGGEGKVPALHMDARIGLAKGLLHQGRHREAVAQLEQALVYCENFGEGRLAGAQENHLYYWLGLAQRPLDADYANACFQMAAQGLAEPGSALYYNDQPPHMIFYQGLALRELGREAEARKRFHTLVDYGEKHFFEPQAMDYFAVSLPDFLVFESDLDEKNRVHCSYMLGLGHVGLGSLDQARAAFDAGLALDPNHEGLRAHRGLAG